MDVLCESCQARFKIADEKLPLDQTVTLKCPKCQNKIKIKPAAQARAAEPGARAESSHGYDASDRPFDYVAQGVQTALICEQDGGIRQTIRSALESLGYQTTDAASAGDALKYMRFHVFDLVVANEGFEGGIESNPVLQYLGRLPMNVRRNMFVVLLGNDFRTGDNVLAFNKSVNLTVNVKNVGDVGKILERALKENEEFYRVFKESLKKIGRA